MSRSSLSRECLPSPMHQPHWLHGAAPPQPPSAGLVSSCCVVVQIRHARGATLVSMTARLDTGTSHLQEHAKPGLRWGQGRPTQRRRAETRQRSLTTSSLTRVSLPKAWQRQTQRCAASQLEKAAPPRGYALGAPNDIRCHHEADAGVCTSPHRFSGRSNRRLSGRRTSWR